MFPFLLGKYTEVEWLGHMVGVHLTFKETDKLFYSHTKYMTVSVPPHPLQNWHGQSLNCSPSNVIL